MKSVSNQVLATLPEYPQFDPLMRRAPQRSLTLNHNEKKLALKNALRYIPEQYHPQMAKEFSRELQDHGRIYGYRFRPSGRIHAKAIEEYQGQCIEGKAIQLMIDNNLDFEIALYPYELVTYGETGQVFQNWMQYQLTMHYLKHLKSDQTLVMQSGHPFGIFTTHKSAPRVIITNGLMIGQFDNPTDFNRAAALGVANYGQMTAGGWMYIGPQGIVHGTYNTLSIAGRLKLGLKEDQNLAGKLFVTSGLGGMSGAQGKAVEIAGGVGIIAEVDESRIATRKSQGWVQKVATSPEQAFHLANQAQQKNQPLSIAFHGNIVDLLQHAVEQNIAVDLISDQTSCHAPYEGGYCPQGIDFRKRTELLKKDPKQFKNMIDQTLGKHFECIQTLVGRGSYFFDYGNAFMKAVFDAGFKSIAKNGKDVLEGFIFPSYVEDILGPELFDYGYGPFRWVCLSGKEADLDRTDHIAAEVIAEIRPELRYQDRDNLSWVKNAKEYRLVVGSQARILYQDAKGRKELALRFNKLVRDKEVGPIMLGRDHHDTGGTDSPFRETSNIKDGSQIMADMATQCFAGNAARGMTICALHNGGGVGVGKSINGGFGLLLDGSERVDQIIEQAMVWDVMVGVGRRSWAGNKNSIDTVDEFNQENKEDYITRPHQCSQEILDHAIKD